MTGPRKILAVLMTIGVLLWSLQVRADEALDLEKATTSYDAGRYEEGAERLRRLLDPKRSNALRDEDKVLSARAYYTACLVALGREQEARQQIDKIYRQRPTYKPDPVVFPAGVIDLFVEERQHLEKELLEAEAAKRQREQQEWLVKEKAREEQEAHLAELRRLASEESVVVRNSRWIAAVPFGVGQFQNGDTALGYTLLVTEVLAAGAALGTTVALVALSADAASHLHLQPDWMVDWKEANQRFQAVGQVANYSSLVFAALAVGGILQAEVAFVPGKQEVRSRPLPQSPPVAPTVSVGQAGVLLGLQGRF
jgi:hypothetical protein